MDSATPIFVIPLVENIPADQLQILDQLWLEASDGRFGFSVQGQI
ncbi:GUN4 domain-containing protein [Vacuolonema iberomarrocanum]|nr:GUN4 domain-containing protein [filamentous cyanobacterium LEGE 07170]